MLKIVALSTAAALLASPPLTSPVLAAPPPGAPPAISPSKIVSATSGGWTNDGSMGHAVLIDDEDNASVDLAIYTGDSANPDQGLKLAAFAHDIASSGNMFGNTAELRQTKTGGLQVYSENTAVGRDKWERTMSLAYRGGHFVVSGLTMMAYDDLNPNGGGGSCDINFLTGVAKSGKKTIKVAAGGIPVEKWSEDMIPKACQF
jgi:hypothetical protein